MTGRQKELYAKYKEYGFEILAIDLYRSETKSTKEYAEQKGLTYPILIADDDVLRRYGGINTTPVIFLIDRSGKVVEVFERFNKTELFEMENIIRSLLDLEPLPLPEPAPRMNLEVLKHNQAPDFSLPTLDGKITTLSRLAHKVVLLAFWSIEDVVSIGILPYCQEVLYKTYPRKDLEIIGIHMDMEEEAKAKVRHFVRANNITLPIVQASESLIKAYGNINTAPVMILIDQYGFVREIYDQFNYEVVSQMEDSLLYLLKPVSLVPEENALKDPELLRIKQLMEVKCARCHYLTRVLLRNKTDEEWESTVYRMREKQTDWISDKEAREIVRYLTRFYSQHP